jgi:hypothetical protein
MDVPVLVLFIDPLDGARVAKGVVMDVWDDGLQVECIHWERAERPTRQIFSESGLRSLACYNPERLKQTPKPIPLLTALPLLVQNALLMRAVFWPTSVGMIYSSCTLGF